MPDFERLAEIAQECGFTHSAPLDVAKLEFMQDVRDMCNADKCDQYGKSWSCPPACATLEEMRERVGEYSCGLLVQTVSELEDSYDWEGMISAGALQKKHFAKMWKELDEKGYGPVFAMGSGACKLCKACAYPDSPCRFPERMEVSMEACGLFVGKVCADNGLAYNYGANKIAFTSCFLLK